MDTRADSIRVMHPLFHAGEGGSTPTSALQLRFFEASLEVAVSLNRLWHSRMPFIDKRLGNRVCYAGQHAGVYYVAAIWSNPAARGLPQETWLELRRLALAPDAPRNAASRMLGWMARDIRVRLPHVERLVSYQDCDVHRGTIYAASGWSPVRCAKGRTWVSAVRRDGRRRAEGVLNKTRWEKVLREAAPC